MALSSAEGEEIAARLASADSAIARAQGELDGPILAMLGPVPVIGSQLEAVDTMATAARGVTARADQVASLLGELVAARDGSTGAERLADLVRLVEGRRRVIVELLDAVAEAEAAVRSLPADRLLGPVAATRESLASRLIEVRPWVTVAREAVDAAPSIMGVGTERRYLVMALDNAEIRPIGGLIAAFATPRFTDGLFHDHTFRDILDIDRADQEEYVEPPAPVADHLLGPETPWQVADAGWWPDFAHSAAEARRLFEIETGDDEFHGAIAFTPELVDALLEIVGPVEIAEADTTVHPGETYLVSLEQVEILNRGEGRKQFLADLASEVLSRLFALPPQRYPEVLAALDEAAKRRHIQVHLDDPDEQAWIASIGWYTPFAVPPGSDRLSIMESNVAPVSKLNVLLEMDHRLEVQIIGDGSGDERLVTTFTNRFGPDLPRELEAVRLAFFEGNLGSFHRRYLDPDAEVGAVFSDHPDRPVTDPGYLDLEAGWLSVGNYQRIEPGVVRLTTEYWVPRVVDGDNPASEGTYRLQFFKQPGRDHDQLTVDVTVPPGTMPVDWSDGGRVSGSTVTFTWTTEFDRFLQVRYERDP